MKKVITTIVIVLAFTACKQENKKVESSSTYETEPSREEVLKIETSSTTSEKGRYSIVTSGQTEFFNNSEKIKQPKKGEAYYGQDAEHTTTPFSYTNNNDGTITDNVTGLMWQKSYEVLSYEDALEKLKTFELGGYTDWRLPTVKEAYSLMNFSGTDVSRADMSVVPDGAIPFIDTDYFDFDYGANGRRIIDVQILSSTFYKGIALKSDEIIFGVNVADGRIKGYPTAMPDGSVAEYTIRFVRGNSDYGKNNFKDNLDNTISDLATDLMWDKSDSKKAMNWEEALAFAQEKNKENYLGYSDWRVPNAKELQSIVDYNRSLQETNSAAIDPIFESTKIKVEEGTDNYAFYWTSTTHKNVNYVSAAAYVCFGEALGYFPESPRAKEKTLMDVHGAGAQRSDPKIGKASDYPEGDGPQGDVIRIDNYVRLVRNN